VGFISGAKELVAAATKVETVYPQGWAG